jgi:hypothetical protein
MPSQNNEVYMKFRKINYFFFFSSPMKQQQASLWIELHSCFVPGGSGFKSRDWKSAVVRFFFVYPIRFALMTIWCLSWDQSLRIYISPVIPAFGAELLKVSLNKPLLNTQ